METELTLENLPKLDFGKISIAFGDHVKRAVDDCMDRPGDSSTRKVVLEVLVNPAKDQSGQCEDVELACVVASRLPVHRSKTFMCRPRKGGHLMFNAVDAEHLNQRTFEDEAALRDENERSSE